MQGRAFVLGFAAGGLLLAVPLWLFSSPGRPALAPDGEVDADAGSSIDASEDVGVLRDELARLRAALREARDQAARTLVEASLDAGADTAEAATSAAVAVVPADRRTEGLLDELDELFRSGVLRERYAKAPTDLAYFLLQTWTEAGHPERALQILERFDLAQEAGGYGTWIGDRLKELGNPSRATDAWLIALRASPDDWDVLTRLADADPEAALRVRAEHLRAGADDPNSRAQDALLLLAAGKREEALKALDALIGEGALPDLVWEQFVRRDPAAAAERLRGRLGQGGDEDGSGRLRLVSALRNLGRPDDARRELTTLLQQMPDNPSAVQALAELDRNAALDYLRTRTTQSPTPASFGMYGEQLLAAGRKEDATTAFWQAWEMAPDAGFQYRLLELAPDRVAPRLIEQATARRDDELFGDVADALWRAGRRQEARSYWQRAADIDPHDSEWTGKLRAVDEGRDPFQ